MDYLRKVIRDILKENVTQSEIVDATTKKYEVILNYTPDENGSGGGERLVQPCAYGRSTAGNYVIRAYQPFGDSSSKSSGWKEFRIDKIKGWEPLKDRTFQKPPGFNEAGDNGMSDVFVMSDFGGEQQSAQGRETANNNTSVNKRYQDLYDKYKQTIDNMKFDYIKKNADDWQNTEINKPLRGNQASINDMSRANNFDTGNEQQTVGPVKKGEHNVEIDKRNTEQPNYTNALKNGPRFKGDEEKLPNNNQEVDNNEVETDEEENEKENG